MNSTKTALLALGAAGALALWRSRREPYRFLGKVALITGGSRGLGLEIARRLASEGASLALVARKSEELERAARELERLGAHVLTIPADLSSPDGPTDVALRARDYFGRIDILVNNAGVMQVGPVDTMTEGDFRQAMDLHYWAPLKLTLACLPFLRQRSGGRIVNISSVGGLVSVPHMLPYCGSKFALVGISEGLRAELARENILVTTVCPGLMRTGSVGQAHFKGRAEWEKSWFAFSASLPGISLHSEEAARRILEACREGKPFLTFTLPARVGMLLSSLAPNLLARILGLVNRILPSSNGNSRSTLGQDLPDRLLTRWQRQVNESAARRNNELPYRHAG